MAALSRRKNIKRQKPYEPNINAFKSIIDTFTKLEFFWKLNEKSNGVSKGVFDCDCMQC